MSLSAKKRGFAPIALIFFGLFIVSAGFAYYKYESITKANFTSESRSLSYSPSPLPISEDGPDYTKNWKVYANPKYNFSVKTPLDWSVKSQQDTNNILITQFQSDNYQVAVPEISLEFSPGAKTGFWMQIRAYPAYNYQSFEQFQYYQENQGKDFPKNFFTGFKNITIGNRKAVLKTGGSPFHSYQDFAYTLNNGMAYQITIISPDNQDELFKKILSTFKFLN